VTGAWGLALRNLRRHRRRNVVTVLAVALGYAGLAILFGYFGFAERLLRDSSVYMQHRGHLAVYAKDGLRRAESKPSEYALGPEVQEKIVAALRADPRVELVGRYLLGGGIAGNGCKSYPIRVVGIEPEVEPRVARHPAMVALWGEKIAPLAGRAFFEAPGVDAPIALAPRLARYLEKDRAISAAAPPAGAPGASGALDCGASDVAAQLSADPFVQLGVRTADGSFGAAEGQAVGVFRPSFTEEAKTGVQAPLEVVQRLFDTDRVTYVAAYLRDPRALAAVERDLAARLRAAGVEASIHRFDDPVANPFFVGTMVWVGAMVFFIVVLVANVVAFSVLNAMTLACVERAREMGTLRSLGFTRRQLRGLFLREATLLTGVAVAVGAALAVAIALAVKAADFRFEPPGSGTEIQLQFTPTPATLAGIAAFFLGLTLVATFVAVRRKAKTPVAALVAEVAA
jgi:putative ABC transport system permease protein